LEYTVGGGLKQNRKKEKAGRGTKQKGREVQFDAMRGTKGESKNWGEREKLGVRMGKKEDEKYVKKEKKGVINHRE